MKVDEAECPVSSFDEIMARKQQDRFALLLLRWKDLEEHTGCRTPKERWEMAQIADAVMSDLIRCWEKTHCYPIGIAADQDENEQRKGG